MIAKQSTHQQGLDDMQRESLQLLYGFAESTRDIALHNWSDAELKSKAIKLAGTIKRDLEEFHKRLQRITAKHDKLKTKRGYISPSSPDLLVVGGQYMAFIEDVVATITPISADMSELLTYDIDKLENMENVSV